jgi:hypothetical protein
MFLWPPLFDFVRKTTRVQCGCFHGGRIDAKTLTFASGHNWANLVI